MENYKEAKEVAIEFQNELKALLIKWNAEIYLDNISNNYNYDYIIKCTIDSNWFEGRCVSEYAEINFGTFID